MTMTMTSSIMVKPFCSLGMTISFGKWFVLWRITRYFGGVMKNLRKKM